MRKISREERERRASRMIHDAVGQTIAFLPLYAGMDVKHGLPYEAALKASEILADYVEKSGGRSKPQKGLIASAI